MLCMGGTWEFAHVDVRAGGPAGAMCLFLDSQVVLPWSGGVGVWGSGGVLSGRYPAVCLILAVARIHAECRMPYAVCVRLPYAAILNLEPSPARTPSDAYSPETFPAATHELRPTPQPPSATTGGAAVVWCRGDG